MLRPRGRHRLERGGSSRNSGFASGARGRRAHVHAGLGFARRLRATVGSLLVVALTTLGLVGVPTTAHASVTICNGDVGANCVDPTEQTVISTVSNLDALGCGSQSCDSEVLSDADGALATAESVLAELCASQGNSACATVEHCVNGSNPTCATVEQVIEQLAITAIRDVEGCVDGPDPSCAEVLNSLSARVDVETPF
jgi:hypothetical protein